MITKDQKKHLRSLAHKLKAVILIGQKGLTEPVLNEINIALDAHELIKIKIAAGDRDEKKEIIASISAQTAAEEVQRIGNTASYFRRNQDKPKILLPKGWIVS